MLKTTQIGIDLGRYEIKIAQVEEVQDSHLNRLIEYESYPVDCEIYSEGYFALLKKAIKEFSRKIKKPRLSLNFIVPINEHSKTLFMNVPSVSERDLDSGIEFELKQAIGEQDNKDYKSTWKISDSYEELNEYEIAISMLSSDVIKAISKFNTINWKINKIILQPIALERFAKDNDIIVDFGYKESRVYMYKDGKLSEVQAVETGAYNVENEIIKYIDENEVEVKESLEEIMSTLYVHSEFIEGDEMINEISAEIEPIITDLIDELKRNIRSFELKNRINIDNIYYAGGLFNLNYLDRKLEAELDSNIKPLNIVSKGFDDVKYDLAGLIAISSETEEELDFAQFAKVNVDYSSMLVGVVAVSLSIMLAMGMLNSKYENILDEQMDSQIEQSIVINNLDEELASVEELINENENFISKIDGLKDANQWLSDVLYVIPEAIPLSVSVTDLNIKNQFVEIKGYSSDYSSIGFFVKELEKYGEVEIRAIEGYNSGKDNEGESEGDTPEGGTIYSVVTDQPENISDKYLMVREFEIILRHNKRLVER